MTKETVDDSVAPLPPPPRWLSQSAKWFRIGLSLFLILSVLLGTFGCVSQAASPTEWRPATSVLPEEVLIEIVKQQSTSAPDPATIVDKSMRVWTMDAKPGEIAVFDFNHPGWCGVGGCYYPVYWIKDRKAIPQPLMAELFYPRLPPNKPLFERGEDNDQPIPCLNVWQAENESMTRLRQFHFCYNGQQYQRAGSQVFEENQRSQ